MNAKKTDTAIASGAQYALEGVNSSGLNQGIGEVLNKEDKRIGGKTLIDVKLQQFTSMQRETCFGLTEADSSVIEIKNGLISQEQIDLIYDEQNTNMMKSIINLRNSGLFAECVDNNKEIEQKQLYLHLGYMDAIQLEEQQSKRGNLGPDDEVQIKTSQEVLEGFHKLAKRCCLPEFSLEDTTQSKKQVFQAYLNQFGQPYYEYKRQASIDRALVKNNFVSNQKPGPNLAELLKEAERGVQLDKIEKQLELEQEKIYKQAQHRKLLRTLRGNNKQVLKEVSVQQCDQDFQISTRNRVRGSYEDLSLLPEVSILNSETSRNDNLKQNSMSSRYNTLNLSRHPNPNLTSQVITAFKASSRYTSLQKNSIQRLEVDYKSQLQQPHAFLSPKVNKSLEVNTFPRKYCQDQYFTPKAPKLATIPSILDAKMKGLKAKCRRDYSILLQSQSGQSTLESNVINNSKILLQENDFVARSPKQQSHQRTPEKIKQLDSIKEMIDKFQGKGNLTRIQSINRKFKIRQVEQSFCNEYAKNCAEIVHNNNHFAPRCLRFMVADQVESIDDQADNLRQVHLDFKAQKNDLHYNVMIERETRAQFCKNKYRK